MNFARFTLGGMGLALGIMLAAQPLSLSGSLSLKPQVASANQGGGKGGGNGGGNGGGHGGGNGGGGAGSSHSAGSNGASASAQGRANAAHASPNALAHAAPNSAVGRVAAYKAALSDATLSNQDIAAAASALIALSNKPITLASVHTLDSRLGLTSIGTANEQAIVDKAHALMASGTSMAQ